MQNLSRILRIIVLIILNLIVLVSTVAVLNLTYAQQNPELHKKILDNLYHSYTPSNVGMKLHTLFMSAC